MRAWTACLAALSACGFATPSVDGGPGRACYGTVVEICFPTGAPTTPVTLPAEIDTGDSTGTGASELCDQTNESASTYCVIAGRSLTLSMTRTLRGVGTRPLVLLSTSSIVIEALAVVDVASRERDEGAGANPLGCANTTARTDSSAGGFGGSFGGKGGTGEAIGGPAVEASNPLLTPPMDIRGGCQGGAGGEMTDGSLSGDGGHGGGAVALIAKDSIHLDGTINASGAGGLGGALLLPSGGGGGGSGGMIVLDAPTITRGDAGLLFANGGGGGQGAAGPTMPPQSSNPGPGDDGGESPAPMMPGLGGNDPSKDGGTGGNGSSSSTSLDGSHGGANGGGIGAVRNGGGGGGGGGAGFIIVRDMTGDRVIEGNEVISPPAWQP